MRKVLVHGQQRQAVSNGDRRNQRVSQRDLKTFAAQRLQRLARAEPVCRLYVQQRHRVKQSEFKFEAQLL